MKREIDMLPICDVKDGILYQCPECKKVKVAWIEDEPTCDCRKDKYVV